SGQITLDLVDPKDRKISAQELMALMRKEVQTVAGVRASIQDPSQQGFGVSKGYPGDFTVRGGDFDQLVKDATKRMNDLQTSGLVADLTTDYQIGAPELDIIPDRARATELGVSVSDLGTTVSSLVGGNTIGKFSSGGRRIDIRMRLLASQRTRPEDLSLV